MERLTQRKEDGTARCPLPEGYEPPCPVVTREALERLAAYEDTGLEPDKLQKLVDAIRKHEVVFLTKDQCLERMLIKVDGDWTGFTIAELQDFLRAKKEGCLVVLPCKIDTPIYLIRAKKEPRKPTKYWVEEYDIDHFTIGGTMIPMITACSKDNEWEELIDGTQEGHEYFLSREEAEEAIKKEDNHESGN